jgi:protein-tyrosine phosphatase
VIEIFSRPREAPFRVVVVSAADISRGPAVQCILRTHLQSLGTAGEVVLTSAGTTATNGETIHPFTARALSAASADSTGHLAHHVTERRLAQADLILAVSREQRSAAADLRPAVKSRVFTVVEFARLVVAAPQPVRDPRELVAGLAGLRTSVRPVDAGEDDLEDPTAGSYRDHERVVRRVDHAVGDIARGLSASFPAPSTRWV